MTLERINEIWEKLRRLDSTFGRELDLELRKDHDEREKIEELIPKTFYANLPFPKRIEFLVNQWNRAIRLLNEKEEENEREER